MGTVWAAIERDTGNEVALKLLHSEHAHARGGIYNRFLQEARIPGQIAKRIKNRSTRGAQKYLLQVTAIGEFERHATPYYAMTRLSGRTLGKLISVTEDLGRKAGRSPGLPVDAAVNAAIGLLFSLEALHQCGVVHRDIKPDNIFLHETPGERPSVVLLDYGISHLMDSGSRTGLAGTEGWIAPECFAGEVGPAADIFAVGVLLFFMLTGVRPGRVFTPKWPEDGETREAPSLAKFGDFMPALVEVVARCLALDPRARPTAVELYTRLQEISNALPPPDAATALTEEDLVERAPPSETSTGISIADVSPATSPDLELSPRMHALRIANERRAILGLPPVARLANNETEPMDRRPILLPAGGRLFPSVTVPMAPALRADPAPVDVLTKPPVPSVPSPAFGPVSAPQYVDSVRPTNARPGNGVDPTIPLTDHARLQEALARGAQAIAGERRRGWVAPSPTPRPVAASLAAVEPEAEREPSRIADKSTPSKRQRSSRGGRAITRNEQLAVFFVALALVIVGAAAIVVHDVVTGRGRLLPARSVERAP
jgi:serine/threonine protein kinase